MTLRQPPYGKVPIPADFIRQMNTHPVFCDAICHAKTAAVREPGLAAMISQDGIDFDSIDEEPAHLFFLIAAPEGGENVHLEVLSRLSRMTNIRHSNRHTVTASHIASIRNRNSQIDRKSVV